MKILKTIVILGLTISCSTLAHAKSNVCSVVIPQIDGRSTIKTINDYLIYNIKVIQFKLVEAESGRLLVQKLDNEKFFVNLKSVLDEKSAAYEQFPASLIPIPFKKLDYLYTVEKLSYYEDAHRIWITTDSGYSESASLEDRFTVRVGTEEVSFSKDENLLAETPEDNNLGNMKPLKVEVPFQTIDKGTGYTTITVFCRLSDKPVVQPTNLN